jgi:Helix-turn-helix domain
MLIAGRGPGVLVELGVTEQRYRAVLEVLEEGTPVVEVARRYGVARQTVHQWLARYAHDGGLAGLAGRSSRTPIDVTIVAGSVQLSKDGKVIRIHPIRPDRARELGAFANPKGRPRRKNSATGNVARVPELRCRSGTGT